MLICSSMPSTEKGQNSCDNHHFAFSPWNLKRGSNNNNNKENSEMCASGRDGITGSNNNQHLPSLLSFA